MNTRIQMTRKYSNFRQAINDVHTEMMLTSRRAERGRWQGVDISKKPEMVAYEIAYFVMNVSMRTYVRPGAVVSLDDLARDIEPNLPWADDHFAERICGEPINPGVEWANWPWGQNADKFRDDWGRFDHNYMQRYWPKWAGLYDPADTAEEYAAKRAHYTTDKGFGPPPVHRGIYNEYGDLMD